MTKMVASEPNDLGRYVIERATAGDVEGRVASYGPNAVLAFPPGRAHPALVSGDLATTATTLMTGEVTVEIARRQPDGSWL